MLKKISLLSLAVCSTLSATSSKNISASYNGNTGVFETPNARILPDWSMRFFINIDSPFKYYGITATPFPFLETNFHMTETQGIDGFNDSEGYGNYKDKSLGIKILLKEEGKYTPAFAFGIDDMWGTALYTSKYLVASKNISYFDLTLGYAKGRLAGEDLRNIKGSSSNSGSFDNNSVNFLKDTDWGGGKPFASIVFNASPKLKLMGEYSSIDYSKDKINPFSNTDKYELPKSKFNYGLKYNYSNNSIFTLSYQRGNQISFGYTYQFGFSRDGIFDHLPDPKWKADAQKLKEYENLTPPDLSEKLSNEVAAEKFKNVKTAVNKNKIWSEINNNIYDSDLKAVGRVISTIDEVAPKKYDTIYMTLKNKEIPLRTFKVNRSEFDMYENKKVSDDYMKNALIISNDVEASYSEFSNDKDIYKTKSYNKKRFNYSIAPKIRTMLNHKDKPFAMKVSLRGSASYDFTDNLNLSTSIEHPFIHTGKDLTSDPLEDERLSIRSDITKHFVYDGTQMPNLTMSYIDRINYNDSFVKVELGYLEYAFAGVDVEWYKPMFDEKFGIGLEYQKVYKREIEDMLGVNTDYTYDSKFLNLYYLISPKYDMHVGAKIGQFLAGDKGVRLDFSRSYKGFVFGAYATITNSNSVFKNSQNQGYIDKGVYLKVPLEVFTYKNLKKKLLYGLSPWTRDVGQSAGTSNSLYPMNNSENNSQVMKKYINKLKE